MRIVGSFALRRIALNAFLTLRSSNPPADVATPVCHLADTLRLVTNTIQFSRRTSLCIRLSFARVLQGRPFAILTHAIR